MAFISMFMAPVPSGNRDAYVDHARKAAAIFRDLGALEVVETWGVDVPDGEVTSMPMAVKLGEGETVVIGWIRWPFVRCRRLELARRAEPKHPPRRDQLTKPAIELRPLDEPVSVLVRGRDRISFGPRRLIGRKQGI